MNIPSNLKYTKDHEWIKVQNDEVLIGITDFAQNELGDIVFIETNTVGENLNEGDTFGTIEAVKTVSDLFMPISGEVLEVNSEIESDPSIVNTEPYDKGWIIKVKPNNLSDIEKLLSNDQYSQLIN